MSARARGRHTRTRLFVCELREREKSLSDVHMSVDVCADYGTFCLKAIAERSKCVMRCVYVVFAIRRPQRMRIDAIILAEEINLFGPSTLRLRLTTKNAHECEGGGQARHVGQQEVTNDE